MAETRDDAVRRLASVDPSDAAGIARLQQEIGTLTILIGDDPNTMSLKDFMCEEVLESLREQEEAKERHG